MRSGRHFPWAALVLTSIVLAGCAAKVPDAAPGADQAQRDLANGYSLLHSLLAKQADVDKVLWIKSAGQPTAALLKDIATASQEGRDWLVQTAEDVPWIGLDRADLPPAEVAVRDAIERTSRGAILLGGDFERRVLLSQISATEYGSHLAKVLASWEKDKGRKAWLRGFEERYADLYGLAVKRLDVATPAAE